MKIESGRHRWSYIAGLLLLTVMMIVLYGRVDPTIAPFSHSDLASYREMAAASPALSSNVIQPFAYRLLGPYLVGLLPATDVVGFYAFSVVSSFCLVVIFYLFLRRTGLSPAVSATSVALLLFNKFWFGFTIWNYFQINDMLSLVFLVILFWAVLDEHWTVFGLCLLMGAVTRECNMLMLPVAFVYLIEKGKLSASWHKLLAASAPGVLAFLSLRLFVPVSGGEGLASAFLQHSAKIFTTDAAARLLIVSSMPVSFIPLIYYKETIRFFKERKYMLVFAALVFLSAMFGSNNERLVAPVFVVFYLLLGNIIQELSHRRYIVPLVIICGFLSSLHHVYSGFPLPSIQWTYALTIGSTLFLTISVVVLRLRESDWKTGKDRFSQNTSMRAPRNG